MRVAQFRTKVFRLGKGERDTTDDSLDYDFEFPHPGGRTTVGGRLRPPWTPLGFRAIDGAADGVPRARSRRPNARASSPGRPPDRKHHSSGPSKESGSPVRSGGRGPRRVQRSPQRMGTHRLQWSERRGPRRVATRFRSFRFGRRVEWGSGRAAPGFVSIPGLHCEAASRSADHGLAVDVFVLLQRILPLVDDLGGVHHAQHLPLAGRQGSSVSVCHGGRSPGLRLEGVVVHG